MSSATSIEWTQATWNPTRGCTRISPGCQHCYAERFAHRLSGPGKSYEGLTRASPQGPRWTGRLRLVPEILQLPLRWRKPRLVFVNSMSDLFHEAIPLDFVKDVFRVMREANWHTFQVLTKRPEYALQIADRLPWPENVWLGVSVETKEYFPRIHTLCLIPAKIRFLSLEPLLGPMPELPLDNIHWVIVGGESGPGARDMAPEWVRQIRDRCITLNVPFFFKQWGGMMKKKTGRTLDGRPWDQMPVAHKNRVQASLF